jgi:raffinose/stachyose/melibiose transport system substrate-binding protein
MYCYLHPHKEEEMNKIIKTAVIGTMSCALALGAAAQAKKLTVAVNFPATDAVFAAITSIASDYAKQNQGLSIDVVTYPSYEDTMKTKMAANDLPDLWATHGWSVARYSEYLQPLNDQLWISKINPAIKPVITDKSGKIFVLPFDVSVAGIAFNREVLDKAGVDPFKIKTWDDFKAACAKVKAIGKIGVHVGGGSADLWTVGNFYDWVAPSFLITNEKSNSRSALKDGSFDWNKWAPVAKLLVEFRDAGFLNPDYTQGTWADVGKKMASGDLAFGLYGNYVIGEAKKYNPKGKYGFMPVPSASKDDSPSLITGEWATLGVWKDSKYKADALKFLAFCARPENVSKIATITGSPTGLVGKGYASEQGDMTPYFKKIEGVRGFPYFDREYLPSGMWNTMCNTGMGLLANTMTIDQAVDKMKNDYDSLRGQ